MTVHRLGQRNLMLVALMLTCACEGAGPETAEEKKQVAVALQREEKKVATTRSLEPDRLAQVCKQACANTAELGCDNQHACGAICQETFSAPVCQKELRLFLACTLLQPAAHWECSDQGTPALRDGYCEREQTAIAACLAPKN